MPILDTGLRRCDRMAPYGSSAHCAARGAAQDRSRRRACVLGVLDHDDPVDEHRRPRAARVLVRVGVGRAVFEICRVEDRDVGPEAFLDEASVPQPQRLRCRSGHLANRLLERQKVLLMDVAADDPRKGPVKSRMRHPLGDHPISRDAVAVRADQSRGRAHDLADIRFADRGDQNARRAVVLDQIVANDIERVPTPRRGERGDGLARVLRQTR